MRSLVILAFAVAAFLPLSGKAQDWLVVNGLVAHLHGTYCNNRITKGLGYEHASGSVRYAVGWYDNSNCRNSAYAAAAWLPLQFSDWRLGTISGVVTGYRSSLTPAGGLVLAYERERWGLNIIGVPPMSESSPGIIWAQLKLRW